MDRRDFLRMMGGALAYAALPTVIEGTPRFGPLEIDGLLTDPVYDDNFNPVTGHGQEIAKKLYPLSLKDAVGRGVINRKMSDFSLPIGMVHGRGRIDFIDGMRDMWNSKRETRSWKNVPADVKMLHKKRDQFVYSLTRGGEKYSLLDYRSIEVQNGVNVIGMIRGMKRGPVENSYEKLLDETIGSISADVLIGYNIHEMTPPTMGSKKINPVFKAWFIDRLFKDGGKAVVEGYPSRFDNEISYGPFQMTNGPMSRISAYNKYVGRSDRVPDKVENFSGLRHHVNAAAIFAYSNWEKIAGRLRKSNLLDEFLDSFYKLSGEERKIAITGITACMHHRPEYTLESITNYLRSGREGKMHLELRDKHLNETLKKYYTSAAEAYMFMNAFERFDKIYGAK